MCWLTSIMGHKGDGIGKRAELRFSGLEQNRKTLGGGENGPEVVTGCR